MNEDLKLFITSKNSSKRIFQMSPGDVIEIMPRMLSLLASSFIGASIYAIGAQVGLEFLGLGDVSTVTWGTNLYWASNDLALLTESWWTFVPTGFCIAMISFALTLINFGIDEVSNPRLLSERLWGTGEE